MFTSADLGRLAVSSIVAVLGFIALNRACGVLPDVIVWWLFYCVGSGVVLNSEAGSPPRNLALLSILPALVPVLMLGFFVLAERHVCLSMPSPWIAVLLPIVSWFSIFVFSFARTPLNQLLQILIHPDTEQKAKRAITVAQLIIAGIATIGLSLMGLGKPS